MRVPTPCSSGTQVDRLCADWRAPIDSGAQSEDAGTGRGAFAEGLAMVPTSEQETD